MTDTKDGYGDVHEGVVEGDEARVQRSVEVALASGVSAGEVLNQALIPAMVEVGRLFEIQEYYIPDMLVSARAMQAGLDLLRPLLTGESGKVTAGKVAIGTVQGDLHDIGKNLVAIMLEGIGMEVQDLGVDVSPEQFVQAARDGAQVVCMSALLTTTMSRMKETIDALAEAGVRSRIKVVVGGAPLTQDFASQIGADGFAPDASSGARLTKQLVQGA
jgi:5-methyltetrahydrofolate--homocysteine methyltransferase